MKKPGKTAGKAGTEEQSVGGEIPMERDGDGGSSPFSLLGIPWNSPQSHGMCRVGTGRGLRKVGIPQIPKSSEFPALWGPSLSWDTQGWLGGIPGEIPSGILALPGIWGWDPPLPFPG